MPATMQSVTTRGFGISGGFTGSAGLVVSLGYGLGEEAAATPHTAAGTWKVPSRTGSWVAASHAGTWKVPSHSGTWEVTE